MSVECFVSYCLQAKKTSDVQDQCEPKEMKK
jgi:hypothetical protein